MTALFTRWLPAATLAAWSSILLYITVGGRIGQGVIGDYLAPPFIPGALIAGLLLAAMAVLFLLAPADADCCAAAECSHPLSRFTGGRVLTFVVLLLPVFVAPVASKQAFLALTQRNRTEVKDGSAVAQTARVRELKRAAAEAAAAAPPVSRTPLELPLPTKEGSSPAATPAPEPAAPVDYLQRTADGTIIVEVLDLLYAAQDNALRKDFEGKAVELIGQLMPDTSNNASGHRFKAVRMFMTCCAADARPVATLVEAAKKPEMPEMSWIKITGTATFPIENGRRIAVLKADKIEASKPPVESMLY